MFLDIDPNNFRKVLEYLNLAERWGMFPGNVDKTMDRSVLVFTKLNDEFEEKVFDLYMTCFSSLITATKEKKALMCHANLLSIVCSSLVRVMTCNQMYPLSILVMI